MSLPPLPPPLPPPVPAAAAAASLKVNNSHTKLPGDTTLWAASYSELQWACQLASVHKNSEPEIWHYTSFQTVRQEGPMCGLVAACMLFRRKITPDKILEIARKLGYTNHGEMFSVKNMFNLLNMLKEKTLFETYTFEHCKERLTNERIIDSLTKGSVLLVPYDCDKNHTPCLKNGHKAHWALITGILTKRREQNSKIAYDLKNTWITAKHGKSNYLGVWKLQQLEDSNRNLYEISGERVEEKSYVYPEGGLFCENGLNRQFILAIKND